MSLDALMGKRYNEETYNCLHFACDVWELETGGKLNDKVMSLLSSMTTRVVDRKELGGFKQLRTPISPCVVVLRQRSDPPHIGVYVRGKIIHLSQSGPKMQIADHLKLDYSRIRYYA